MKRRSFLKILASSTGALLLNSQEVLAVVANKVKIYAKEGVLGFKKTAPIQAVKSNKRCENCKFYKMPSPVDPLCPNEGFCTLPGMKNAMKSQEVYVESKSYCNMWQKAPTPAGTKP